jgi:hypothetical protein
VCCVCIQLAGQRTRAYELANVSARTQRHTHLQTSTVQAMVKHCVDAQAFDTATVRTLVVAAVAAVAVHSHSRCVPSLCLCKRGVLARVSIFFDLLSLRAALILQPLMHVTCVLVIQAFLLSLRSQLSTVPSALVPTVDTFPEPFKCVCACVCLSVYVYILTAGLMHMCVAGCCFARRTPVSRSRCTVSSLSTHRQTLPLCHR